MKTEQGTASSMDALLGAGREVILAYFGQPRIRYHNLWVCDRPGGSIALIFRDGAVSAFAVYRRDGSVLLARNLTPVAMDGPQLQALAGTLFRQFAKAHRLPHTDLGSGQFIPAYLSDHGSCYWFQLDGGKIRRAVEIPLLDSPPAQS